MNLSSVGLSRPTSSLRPKILGKSARDTFNESPRSDRSSPKFDAYPNAKEVGPTVHDLAQSKTIRVQQLRRIRAKRTLKIPNRSYNRSQNRIVGNEEESSTVSTKFLAILSTVKYSRPRNARGFTVAKLGSFGSPRTGIRQTTSFSGNSRSILVRTNAVYLFDFTRNGKSGCIPFRTAKGSREFWTDSRIRGDVTVRGVRRSQRRARYSRFGVRSEARSSRNERFASVDNRAATRDSKLRTRAREKERGGRGRWGGRNGLTRRNWEERDGMFVRWQEYVINNKERYPSSLEIYPRCRGIRWKVSGSSRCAVAETFAYACATNISRRSASYRSRWRKFSRLFNEITDGLVS